MKKTLLVQSIALAVMGAPLTIAHAAESTTDEVAFLDKSNKVESRQQALMGEISALKEQYSEHEVLSALGTFEPQEEASVTSKLHGTLGSAIEIEIVRRDDGIKEGKLKFTLIQGNFRYDDLPGWDFGFYSGREELFNGNLKHAQYDRGVNAIQEIYTNRSYSIGKGSLGWGVKLAGESIDKRTTPGAKIFGSYPLTDRLEVHGYALYHVEYKRGTGEFPYWEVEPGLGYKFSDNSGAWLNFRIQQGQWKAKDGYSETEMEMIIKPGVWYNMGKLSASLWAEIGNFEKEKDSDGSHLWTEEYIKMGVSANYPITNNWRVFGEVSYKDIDFENGPQHDPFDGYIPLMIAGINYSF